MGRLIEFVIYSFLNGFVFVGETLLSTNSIFLVIPLVFAILIYKAEKEEIDEMLIEDQRDIV